MWEVTLRCDLVCRYGSSATGLQSVSVSVDGTEGSHDALRGVRGSFDAALQAIGHARAAGLQVSANTQIGRANVRDVPPLFDRLVSAGIAAWQVQLTVPMGRAADEPEIVLEPYQMIEVMPMLAHLKSVADERGSSSRPGNNIGYFGSSPAEEHLRDSMPAQGDASGWCVAPPPRGARSTSPCSIWSRRRGRTPSSFAHAPSRAGKRRGLAV